MIDLPTQPDPADAPPIRWGILAPGHIAHKFAHDVAEYTSGTVAAVGSRSLERAQAFAAEFGIPRAYGSYEELVADAGVDAVYVASPHSEHKDQAILALEAGKPVLVEKSFTLNAAQAEDVFAVARKQNLFAMEAMWARFLPHYPIVKALVEQGELGDLVSLLGVHTQALDTNPERRLWNLALAGGALLDLGIYPLSLLHFLLGVPDEVVATGTLTNTGVDLRETIVLRYGDALATAVDDMGAHGLSNAAIIGTQGRVDLPDRFYNPQDVVFTPLGGEPQVIEAKVEGGFQYEIAEAARRIAAGDLESPLMPWQQTVEVLQTCDEVRRQLGVVYPGE
jgi:predicted dehydrogenase